MAYLDILINKRRNVIILHSLSDFTSPTRVMGVDGGGGDVRVFFTRRLKTHYFFKEFFLRNTMTNRGGRNNPLTIAIGYRDLTGDRLHRRYNTVTYSE